MSKRKIIKLDEAIEEDEYIDGVEYEDYYIEQVEQDCPEQDDDEMEESLEDALRVWAVKYKVSHPAIDDLLRILIGQGITNLPANAVNLLRLNTGNSDEGKLFLRKINPHKK